MRGILALLVEVASNRRSLMTRRGSFAISPERDSTAEYLDPEVIVGRWQQPDEHKVVRNCGQVARILRLVSVVRDRFDEDRALKRFLELHVVDATRVTKRDRPAEYKGRGSCR